MDTNCNSTGDEENNPDELVKRDLLTINDLIIPDWTRLAV